MTKIISPPGRRIFSQEGWHVFYDPVNVKWIKVNESGKEIILALEENPILEEAVKKLKGKYDVEESKIYRFVDYLVEEANYLHKGEYRQRKIGSSKEREDDYPAVLYLHPTYRCNLDCVYCYNAKEREKYRGADDHSELSLKEYQNLFKEAKELGVEGVIFTGGEPLLRKDIFQLAELSRKMGFGTSIITNGTLISRDNAQTIIDHFQGISVSIDSCQEAENDLMRGKGAFKKALQGIRCIRSLGGRVSCVGVSHKANIDSILDSRDFFVNQLGCTSFLPQLYIPAHEKMSAAREIESFVAKYAEIRSEVNKINQVYGRLGVRDSCSMCVGELAIGADGNVFPCQSLLKEEFCGGNIREDSLKNILDHSPVFKEIRKLSVDDMEACSECDIKYLCGGGCRAFHYEICKDLRKTDTRFCQISRKVIVDDMFASAVHPNRGESQTEARARKAESVCL